MFYSCIESVKRDIKFQNMQLQRYRKEKYSTRNFKNYGLTVTRYRDNRYYKVIDKQHGEVEITYVGANANQAVKSIQKRRFLMDSIARMEHNIKAMNRLCADYFSIEPIDVRNKMPIAYRFIDDDCFDLSGAINVEKWGKTGQSSPNLYPEDLKHTDICGEKMRSKSEVLIANALAARGIKYQYERKISISGNTLVPDFVVLSEKKNKEIYWEHFGMLSDEAYFLGFTRKLKMYYSGEILPNRDLVMTFDDYDGSIDAETIEAAIETYII